MEHLKFSMGGGKLREWEVRYGRWSIFSMGGGKLREWEVR